MTTTRLSIKDAITFGMETCFAHKKFFIISGLMLAILQYIPEVLVNSETLRTENLHIFIIITTITTLIGIYIGFGITRGSLQSIDNQKPELKLLTQTKFKEFIKYILILLTQTLITLIGFILLIVPGIYLMLRFFTVDLTFIDKNLLFWDNFKESEKLTKGKKGKIFSFIIAIVTLNLIGTLTFYIGSIITIPASIIATAHFYKQLKDLKA